MSSLTEEKMSANPTCLPVSVWCGYHFTMIMGKITWCWEQLFSMNLHDSNQKYSYSINVTERKHSSLFDSFAMFFFRQEYHIYFIRQSCGFPFFLWYPQRKPNVLKVPPRLNFEDRKCFEILVSSGRNILMLGRNRITRLQLTFEKSHEHHYLLNNPVAASFYCKIPNNCTDQMPIRIKSTHTVAKLSAMESLRTNNAARSLQWAATKASHYAKILQAKFCTEREKKKLLHIDRPSLYTFSD